MNARFLSKCIMLESQLDREWRHATTACGCHNARLCDRLPRIYPKPRSPVPSVEALWLLFGGWLWEATIAVETRGGRSMPRSPTLLMCLRRCNKLWGVGGVGKRKCHSFGRQMLSTMLSLLWIPDSNRLGRIWSREWRNGHVEGWSFFSGTTDPAGWLYRHGSGVQLGLQLFLGASFTIYPVEECRAEFLELVVWEAEFSS